MGFFAGALSGALVAGGVYYAYSSTIQQRTAKHCTELRALSRQLEDPPIVRNAPAPAVTRVPIRPFRDQFMQKWNEGLQGLSTIDRKVEEITKRLFRS
ncbi:hypothetical protein EXIGLDRAFT_780958 [Exidia glandulosa HHB12029]|uniref:MICOS complex subunit MIC12 n=1 Tax=Exidia glandulosa HHB12029 TaxID=1314781 RepID=A0A165BE15_EXIGL|nr:hypothetical protein EXIGLDRAFT_780958 [Exidia glandulosa HHB12029]